MRPNADKTAMARPAASLAILLALGSPALAGDRALIDIIGYSQSGQYFAFTESGIQDGSGFPYANIFVVDVEANHWVAGTPVRVRHDDEAASLGAVRQDALAEARPTLDKLDIAYPADIWALSGDGVAGLTDTLTFGIPGYGMKTVGDEWELWLESYEAPSTQPCSDYTDQTIKGFRLSMVQNGEWFVHVDDTVPNSRGCPLDYSLFAVVAPMGAQDLTHAVALISVFPLGFEGPDRRFMAVPIDPW